MKKLLTLALCSIMVLGLGSCGKKNSSSNPVSSNPDTTTTEESADTGTSDTGSTDSGSSDATSSEDGSSSSETSEPDNTDSQTVTLYFENNWLWTKVCAYVFNLSDESNVAAFPGEAAQLVTNNGTDGHEMYVVEIDITAYDTVIFSGIKDDGTGDRDKSPDINIADITSQNHNAIKMLWADANSYESYAYTLAESGEGEGEGSGTGEGEGSGTGEGEGSGTGEGSGEGEGTGEGSGEGEGTTPTPESYTFYYYNNLNWTDVYVYSWGDNVTAPKWPGEAATAVEGEANWYYVTFSAKEVEGLRIIFNNNGENTTGPKQTPNLIPNVEKPYYYGDRLHSFASKEAAVTASAINAPTYAWYLKGSMNDWRDNQDFGLSQKEGSTTEYVVNNIYLDASSEFKVAGASWHGISDVKDGCSSLVEGTDNIKIKESGYYNIYFDNVEGQKIWIEKVATN